MLRSSIRARHTLATLISKKRPDDAVKEPNQLDKNRRYQLVISFGLRLKISKISLAVFLTQLSSNHINTTTQTIMMTGVETTVAWKALTAMQLQTAKYKSS